MKKGKILALVLSIVLIVGTLGLFAGCSKVDETKLFRIVALKGGRGETYVNKLVEEFKQYADEGIEFEVQMFPSATFNKELDSMMNSGKNPDLLFANLNMPDGPIDKLVKGSAVLDVSSVLGMTIPGETKKVSDKLVDGILNNYSCRPYGNGKTYLMPAFYSPTGLFYDASRFGTGAGKYTLPTTWAEFFKLGDDLNTARQTTATTPYLFTYPTTGYFDSVVYPLIAQYAGMEKYEKALGHAAGIWQDAQVKEALTQIAKLKDYLEPNTVGQANKENFTKNQQAVIGKADGSEKGTALFIPNGDWLPGEMVKTTPEGFNWGFMPLPKATATGASYINSFIETMLIPTASDNQELGKKFMAFYYGDKSANIMAKESGAIIPTNEALTNAAANGIADSTIALYDVYKTAGVVVGQFVATSPVADVVWSDILFDVSISDIMKSKDSVTTLVNKWATDLQAASDKLRAAIIK